MPDTVLVSVFCPDRTGLVSAITSRLFDLGANLGDTNFAVLGTGAEFTSVCEVPGGTTPDFLVAELDQLPELAGGEVSVRPFVLDPEHGPRGEVTHRVTVSGGDQPGLIAGLCETFVQFKANIVSLSAGRSGSRYAVQIAVSIPPESADACLATVANTAENLQLDCYHEDI